MMTTDNSGSSPDHSWRLRFEDRTGYLYAEASGPEDSLAITVAYWRAVAAECLLRKATHLLVCDRLRGEPASREEFAQLSRALAGSGLEQVRMAFHEPVSDHLRSAEFGELAMREEGFTLRVFGSEREAEMWLRYGES
jgi:hypothetical protein